MGLDKNIVSGSLFFLTDDLAKAGAGGGGSEVEGSRAGQTLDWWRDADL